MEDDSLVVRGSVLATRGAGRFAVLVPLLTGAILGGSVLRFVGFRDRSND